MFPEDDPCKGAEEKMSDALCCFYIFLVVAAIGVGLLAWGVCHMIYRAIAG